MRKKFNILLVVPLDYVAGAEVSSLFLAKGLHTSGHQVTLLCNKGPLLEEFNKIGIKVVQSTINLRGPWGLLKAAWEIRKRLLSGEFHIIHLQNAFLVPAAFLATRSIRSGRVSIVWHCRGIKDVSYFIAGRLFNYLTDFVIANCESEKRRLVENGLKNEKVRTILNCLNISPPDVTTKNMDLLNELRIQPTSPIVGTVARLAKNKGIDFLLEAAFIVAKEIPDVKFIIVGHGPLEARLKKRVDDLGLAKRVVFLGVRRDLHRIYSTIDVLVVPSIDGEATNNPVAEAMAFAKPVVATRIGGIPELVHQGDTGILVPPRDSQELAKAILLLLNDKDLSTKIGSAGQKRVLRDFSLSRLIHEVEEVYEGLTTDTNGS